MLEDVDDDIDRAHAAHDELAAPGADGRQWGARAMPCTRKVSAGARGAVALEPRLQFASTSCRDAFDMSHEFVAHP